MEEMSIKRMYMDLTTEEDKIKFLQWIFKEINDISNLEIENGQGIITESELKARAEQITNHLRDGLRDLQTYMRVIYSKKQIIEYKERITQLERQYKENIEKAEKEITRRKEEVQKVEKKIINKCKQDLKAVRGNLIRTTYTAQDLGEKVSNNETNQELTLRSINNILIGCEKAARCIKQLEFWPTEDEQFPEIIEFSIQENTSETREQNNEQEEKLEETKEQIEVEEEVEEKEDKPGIKLEETKEQVEVEEEVEQKEDKPETDLEDMKEQAEIKEENNNEREDEQEINIEEMEHQTEIKKEHVGYKKNKQEIKEQMETNEDKSYKQGIIDEKKVKSESIKSKGKRK